MKRENLSPQKGGGAEPRALPSGENPRSYGTCPTESAKKTLRSCSARKKPRPWKGRCPLQTTPSPLKSA